MNDRIKELVRILNQAADAYYNGEEIMSNFEYDKLYDELVELENRTGIILSDSPTKNVGAEVVDQLPKATHKYPALSLAKTKNVDDYCASFQKYICSDEHQRNFHGLEGNLVVVSWKLDGSTVVCTYEPDEDGKSSRLVSLVTRGNGEIGSVITHNAPYIHGIPMKIPDYCGNLIVRGEALMSYEEFDRINSSLPVEEQFKNPRNLANATISLLDSREMRKRKINFKAFELVEIDTPVNTFSANDYISDRLLWLSEHGFDVVPYSNVYFSNLKGEVEKWTLRAKDYEFPVDGLVSFMNDRSFSQTLKGTAHNPHIMCGYALKWEDEVAKSTLRDIEWSASRTGLLNPVAVFDPVELAGTTVIRASLHNLSYIESLNLQIGDEIGIIKANMIIPQVVINYSKLTHPQVNEENFKDLTCPVCHEKVSIKNTVGATNSLVVMCENSECVAKHIGKLVHFCERDCMNLIGMSEMTISKFIDAGIIREYQDFFMLDMHPEIAVMEGFGERSWQKMVTSAYNASQHVTFVNFIHSLGIPNIGKGQAKLLKNYILDNYSSEHETTVLKSFARLIKERFDFTNIDGVGEVLNQSIYDYFTSKTPFDETIVDDIFYDSEETEIGRLLTHLRFEDEWASKTSLSSGIAGKTFVITGAVNHFKNRDELKEKIESLGGKCTGSVTKNTDFLINNDVTSTSGKNKKAKELNIPIISEDEFLKLVK